MRINIWRRALFILAPATALCLWPGAGRAETPIPPLRTAVTDLTGTLSSSQAAELESKLREFDKTKGSQVAVLIVPSTKPETIEQYSIRVFESWKLGRKGMDDGVLFTVAMQDRTMRIEVGYGLEGALPDAICKRITSELVVPRFKEGDYATGISAGVDAILKSIAGEKLPSPASAGQEDFSGWEIILIPIILFIVVFFIILSKAAGRAKSGRRGPPDNGSGYYGGGSDYGNSSNSGSDSGGGDFSGGGGESGGGGSSDNW
ncbi:MAG: YgcG family protein [Nitrospinae bacterium]|nr:YgcG family protein [Nitrospinota bacterium]